MTPLGDAGIRRLAWTAAGLFAVGRLGHRLHDASGRMLVDGHHTPVPASGSAWMTSAVTRDGSQIYYLHHHRLAGVVVADGRALPAPDITPFARPDGNAAWAFPDLAISDDGRVLALGFLDEVLVWRTSDRELLARIVPIGVQITGASVCLDEDQLVATFTHVMANGGQRKTIAAYDVATGRISDVITTPSEWHGSKGGAATARFIPHGAVLSRVAAATRPASSRSSGGTPDRNL